MSRITRLAESAPVRYTNGVPHPLQFLLQGLLIGFTIAAPVGPIGILCIRRTLTEGRLAGFVSGLGAATADAIYGACAGFGLVTITRTLLHHQFWLRIIGGIFLGYFGIKAMMATVNDMTMIPTQRINLPGAFFSTLLITLTSPITILVYAAVFAGLGLGHVDNSLISAAALVVGVYLGSTFWWLLLSSLVSLLHARLSVVSLYWVNRSAGIILIIFGLLALAATK